MSTKNGQNRNTYYAPHPTLVDFIDDLLGLKRKYEESDGKEKKALDRELKVLKRRKYDILNVHIFRAMANLTYLLEMMQAEPFIREKFDDDIKALFLSKSRKKHTDEYIFDRFVRATCRSRLPKENQNPKDIPQLPDFRSILCNRMQTSIIEAMHDVAPFIFLDKFGDPAFSTDAMLPQLRSAHSWTRLFASEAYRHYMPLDMKTRPPLF